MCGVQVIKMYAWEVPFTKLINYTRKMELKMVQKTSYIRAFHMTSWLFTTRLALLCTMVAIVLIDGPDQIDSSKIFEISTYLSIVSHLMSQRFSRSIAEVAEVMVALRRLEKLLHLDEKITELDVEKGVMNGKSEHVAKVSSQIAAKDIKNTFLTNFI